jgi:ABC-type antimicrobial peptide transport system permease subunit
MFTAEQRTKEIGVRKVLGASVLNILGLLTKDFLGLILIAQCIAIPIAYYTLNHWLHRYEYRTNISWWVFVLTALSTMFLTLLTVSYQSIKAALVDPVNRLRTE